MALLQPTLASGLAAIAPSGVEATCIQQFVDAWESYFAGASVLGAAAQSGSYSAGLSAMSGAMVGMSAPGAAAASIQAGIAAFWAAIASLGTSIWLVTPPPIVVPPLTPPPTIGGTSAALVPVFASNTAGGVDQVTAWGNIAAVLHTNGGLGGLQPTQVLPAAPVPTPIL